MRIFRKYKEKASETKAAFIQPKLNIGKPGDKYEVEADAMADKVVNNSASNGTVQKMESAEEEVQQKPLAASITPLVQKQSESLDEENVQAKCAGCEEEDKVQRMEEEEDAVQTKSQGQHVAPSNIESSLRSSKGGGSTLSGNVKNEMESGFGTDFSQVNIHTNRSAVQMNKQINAQAFTHGNDIYFNEGKYNPSSKEGKHLLAHELTHTIQQKGTQNESRSNNSIDGKIMTYRRGGDNFRGCDTATLKEKRYKKGDPWLKEISVDFTSVVYVSSGDSYPLGKLVGKYHKGKLPDIASNIGGGKASQGISDRGRRGVERIKGCGYHSSRSPEIPKEKRLKKGNKKYFKPEFANLSSMSYALFYKDLQALHKGGLDHGSLSCVHVPTEDVMRQLNYHSRIGKTKVDVSYDASTLKEICCERASFKGKMVNNPCSGQKMKDCP